MLREAMTVVTCRGMQMVSYITLAYGSAMEFSGTEPSGISSAGTAGAATALPPAELLSLVSLPHADL